MKKIDHFLFLFLSLVFIFSCNTEEKFGFRKKIKVYGQPLVEAKANRIIVKPEITIEPAERFKTTEASASSEKIILLKVQKNKFIPNQTFSVKKIFIDSTNQKKKSEPLIENKLAKAGKTFGIVGFIFLFLGFLINPFLIISLLLGILGLFLSLASINQREDNKEKFKKNQDAMIGICLGLFCSLLSLLIFIATLKISIGGSFHI